MNGIDFLADTNAVLYYLSGNSCMKPFITCRFAFSIISEMELLSYSKITDDEEKKIGGFLNGSLPILITNEIKNMTIQLRRKYNIKLPDAIIAASAIESDLVLMTADSGFKKIDKLQLEILNPEISFQK
jgi:hypothetical protein